jgi:PAS domain S-box-containing protein
MAATESGRTEGHPRAARLFALVNSSPLALVEYGMDRRIRLWNPAAERIFGWTSDEMLGRDDLPMAPPHRRTEGEDLFDRVLAGEWLNDYETVRQRKDGSLVAVSIAAAPVREASGRVVGNLVAYTDITERKAQAEEVHRLNEQLHARLEELDASWRASVPVEITEIPEGRLSQSVEAAAYYLIAEALTNVAKYARASRARVRVVAEPETVLVEVSDDGAGGADPEKGSGLCGLTDRVEALGGSLEISSPPGDGTCLRATIPSRPRGG